MQALEKPYHTAHQPEPTTAESSSARFQRIANFTLEAQIATKYQIWQII